jgi:methanol---5-hydroxybenzimidazolylcobamide Co-methyltransferase
MQRYTGLTISAVEQLTYGQAPKPLTTRRGLVIGGGMVYPEVNFTLPPTEVSRRNLPHMQALYREMIEGACARAVELESDGLVVEFETLIEMTTDPGMAIDLTKLMCDVLEEYYQKHGLKSAFRITPNDTRELIRPPFMRHGAHFDAMLETFEGCARAGADLLAIESTGGKELHDDALLTCDIAQVLFALTVMGARDMAFLWKRIVDIAEATGTHAAGDTACGFGNTAMVLAEKRYIPRVFAAVVRAVTAVRSLVAYEQGAVGPGKDCGYENPFLKAITGYPMAMEGKSAACAHLSPVGNIAAATCDLWSNESVQHVKLLGGMTPVISTEQLIYDCRLMNVATERGQNLIVRDLLTLSDQWRDPQALILSPENVLRIARAIVNQRSCYDAGRAAALEALSIIDEAVAAGRLKLPEQEQVWPSMLRMNLETLPATEQEFIAQLSPVVDSSKFRPEEYGL